MWFKLYFVLYMKKYKNNIQTFNSETRVIIIVNIDIKHKCILFYYNLMELSIIK